MAARCVAGKAGEAACTVTALRRRGPLNCRVRGLVTPIDSDLVSAGASSAAASGPVAFCSDVLLQPELRPGAALLAVQLALRVAQRAPDLRPCVVSHNEEDIRCRREAAEIIPVQPAGCAIPLGRD